MSSDAASTLFPWVLLMPLVQHAIKEVQLKVVYYGPGLGGKTTNLQFLYGNSRPELRGKLLSLTAEGERTIFFDLLPVALGTYKDYRIRLHLCTVPGQIAFDRTRRLVLRHVDGVVFVVDSQRDALELNVESIANLEKNLALQGDDPRRIPLAVQYNKRDLPNILTVSQLHEALGVPAGVPEIEACAREGKGVPETLKAIVKACLRLVAEPLHSPEGRFPSMLPRRRASMIPAPFPPPALLQPDYLDETPTAPIATGYMPRPFNTPRRSRPVPRALDVRSRLPDTELESQRLKNRSA